MVLAVRGAFPFETEGIRNAHVICFCNRHNDRRSQLPDIGRAGPRAYPASQPLILPPMIRSSIKRKKHDKLGTDRLDRISHEGPERPSAEDDAIDAAIKSSIDKFGA